MVKLICKDVDGWASCRGEWQDEPTVTMLAYLLAGHYDEDQTRDMARELLLGHDVHVDDTVFTLV